MAVTYIARPGKRPAAGIKPARVRYGQGMQPNPRAGTLRLAMLRLLAVSTIGLGLVYLGWRWSMTLNWQVWWLAVPLVVAETYSFTEVSLLAVTTWRARRRAHAPAAPQDLTVDVLITTFDEPVSLVLTTARAANAIRHPHKTWILDDGSREVLRLAAEVAGIGYIARPNDASGRPVHAEAGSLNNALLATDGEFLLLLAADQVPMPEMLDSTLGYFADPWVAFVQTPQTFGTATSTNPIESAAPMYFGSVQQGNDGWGAAQFCGSNAVVRRDALMQLGITRYVADVERSVKVALQRADRVLAQARSDARRSGVPIGSALDEVATALRDTRAAIKSGTSLDSATFALQNRVEQISRGMVSADLAQVAADLAELRGSDPADTSRDEVLAAVIDQLAGHDASPLAALETVRSLIRSINVDRADEEQELMPLAKLWVTEDLATSMRLQRLGWKSVYHPEVLVDGLEPTDFGAVLWQRLRRAQGALTVLLRENPLTQRGLDLGQRLTYFATPWSVFGGFATVVYLIVPAVILLSGLLPVSTTPERFAIFFLPYLASMQLLLASGSGGRFWRRQQHAFALFPTWIAATVSAIRDAVLHTPGRGQLRGTPSSPAWRVIPAQTAAAVILVIAAIGGVLRLVGHQGDPVVIAAGLVWVAIDLLALNVVFRAARYRGYRSREGDI